MGQFWRRVGRYLIPWALVGLFFSGQTYLNYLYAKVPLGWGGALYLGLSEWSIWAALSPFLYYLARRFPLSRGRWGWSLAIHVPVTFGITLAKLLLHAVLELAVHVDADGAPHFTQRGVDTYRLPGTASAFHVLACHRVEAQPRHVPPGRSRT